VIISLDSAKSEVLPVLDHWAKAAKSVA